MAASAVIGSLRVNLGLNSAEFQSGLVRSQKNLSKFSKAMKVGLLAAATAAGAAVGALAKSVSSTIDAADEMSKAAQKIGIPIEELSRLKYAADLSGVSMGTLEGAIKRLSGNMTSGLTQPTGVAAKQFAAMGIELKNADGSMRATSDVMADVADVLAELPDGAEKTALAMRLMGRSGAEMIPMLNQGADALKAQMKEADTFGQVFTKEMGANAEAFNDNISRLTGVFANLAAKIATAVLPYLTQFTNWLVANSPLLSDWASKAGDAIEILVEQFELARADIETLRGGIEGLIRWFANLDAKIRETGDVMRSMASTIVEKFAALPAQMEEIGRQIVEGLIRGIYSKAVALNQAIDDVIRGYIIDPGKAALGVKSPSTVFHEIGSYVMQGLTNGMQSMAGNVSDIASSIASTIGDAFQSVIDGSKSVKEALADTLKSVGSMLMNSAVQSIFGGLFGGGKADPWAGLRLPGFANGGSFAVGGAGGIDSQMVAFRASPNEQVSVTKPGNDNMRGGLTGINVNVSGANGDQHIIDLVHQGVSAGLRAYDKGTVARISKALPEIPRRGMG